MYRYIYIYILFISANCLMVTDALGHMRYCYTLLVPMSQRLLNKSSNEHNA